MARTSPGTRPPRRKQADLEEAWHPSALDGSPLGEHPEDGLGGDWCWSWVSERDPVTPKASPELAAQLSQCGPPWTDAEASWTEGPRLNSIQGAPSSRRAPRRSAVQTGKNRTHHSSGMGIDPGMGFDPGTGMGIKSKKDHLKSAKTRGTVMQGRSARSISCFTATVTIVEPTAPGPGPLTYPLLLYSGPPTSNKDRF